MTSAIIFFILSLFAAVSGQFLSEMEEKLVANAENLEKELTSTKLLNQLAEMTQNWQESVENAMWNRSQQGYKLDQCDNDWEIILGYTANKNGTLKFWDSYGVPGTGILEGHIFFLGQPEECANAKSGVFLIKTERFPRTEQFIITIGPVLSLGVCAPSSCSAEQISGIFQAVVDQFVDNIRVGTTKKGTFNPNTAFVIAATVYGIIGVLIVCATIFSVTEKIIGEFLAVLRSLLIWEASCKILEETWQDVSVRNLTRILVKIF